MDTLRRSKLKRVLGLAIPLCLLGGVLVFHALRPSPEEAREQDFTSRLMEMGGGRPPAEAREALRREWMAFPPESRSRIFRRVAGVRLDEFRQRTSGLSEEERLARIREAVVEMRRARSSLPEAERRRIRERMDSAEGREMVRHVMEFYREELTARERAEMDPLMHEWLARMEDVMRGR